MTAGLTNRAIVDAMHRCLRPRALTAAKTQPCAGFTITDFDVTYPNKELMAEIEVLDVPAGVTLVGVTVVAAPDRTSKASYCMGVVSQSRGLALPVTVLAASTSLSFDGPTRVTGIVILAYTRDGKNVEECEVAREFTVG